MSETHASTSQADPSDTHSASATQTTNDSSERCNDPEGTSHFRIELGINLRGATMTGTNPNSRFFPLQHEMIDITDPHHPRPAWPTQPRAGDRLSFRLVDISSLDGGPAEHSYPRFAVIRFYFTRRDVPLGVEKSPFVGSPHHWQIASSPEHSVSPVYSRPLDKVLPTWKIHHVDERDNAQDEVTFAPVQGRRIFELSVLLAAQRGTFVDQFIVDPEMIVSGTSGGG